jgi:hypothetical protein
MSLDTVNPKHGRHALRIVVPTAVPLVFPFTSSPAHTMNPNYFVIQAGLVYSITFWARSITAAGMRLDLIFRQTGGDNADPGARAAPAVAGATLTELWQQISVELTAEPDATWLYLRATGAGTLFLDHVQIGATREGETVSCSFKTDDDHDTNLQTDGTDADRAALMMHQTAGRTTVGTDSHGRCWQLDAPHYFCMDNH